ncbi:PDZ domain-containing protein [Virgibacillus sp. C22-A2]|uniref:PDZ domain-containing protein n=1 Tax=Virgibacillus tibetensis TaxID=3042313 RepID=A0ABU6KBZ1_9BACI|nr:PDZ domain-containing protein [Virgibacillus sp. C22-A2]
MLEVWLIELAKGIGKLFLNPLLYWSILLILIVGNRRIKKERMNFGSKVFDVFSEWKNTWILAIISGICISLFTLGTGIVFSYETLLLLSIVMIILSLSTLKFTMLSASYTVGITYILLLFLPSVLKNQNYVDADLFSQTNFTGLVVIMGILLIVEGIILSRVRRNETYPELVLGSRGVWVGQHHLKKMSLIPFFTLVPTGLITPMAAFWPYFSLGGETYSLILIPFLICFDHIVRGSLPGQAAGRLAKSTILLGAIVILIAVGSIFIQGLSLAAVIIAILGREYINYKHRMNDRQSNAFFHQMDKGLKVLGIIPGTPADRLEIVVGETVVKVNGQRINSVEGFYQALQESGASFKLELLDDAGEIRFVRSALYEGDHHELGLIFLTNPYRVKKRKKTI